MALDIDKLASDMLNAAKSVFTGKWREVKDYAESEFRKLGENIVLIGKLRAKGRMSQEKARLHLEMQKLATRNVLIAIEGIGIILAEQAINAALGVIRDAVNKAVGFPLL